MTSLIIQKVKNRQKKKKKEKLMRQQKEGNQAGRVQQGKREDKTKTIIGTKYKINNSENTET